MQLWEVRARTSHSRSPPSPTRSSSSPRETVESLKHPRKRPRVREKSSVLFDSSQWGGGQLRAESRWRATRPRSSRSWRRPSRRVSGRISPHPFPHPRGPPSSSSFPSCPPSSFFSLPLCLARAVALFLPSARRRQFGPGGCAREMGTNGWKEEGGGERRWKMKPPV